ncbi:antibiotic resistance protein VanZ [Halobacteriales archaeon QS_4_70_19]|nr:MAG: antibiotic resistance protein VanZ [Halobacteriales archaeon QS_4_70_19]
MSRLGRAQVGRASRLVAPVAVAVFLLAASVAEPSGGPPAPPILGLPADKLLHAGSYATLAAALAVGLATPGSGFGQGDDGRLRSGRVVALAVLGAAAYGLALEGVQYPLPYRTFDPLDAAANTVGAALGAAAWLAAAPVRRWVGW